jgi:hypothetical protein
VGARVCAVASRAGRGRTLDPKTATCPRNGRGQTRTGEKTRLDEGCRSCIRLWPRQGPRSKGGRR